MVDPKLFLRLANPWADPPPAVAPGSPDIDELLALANRHGVLPTVMAHLPQGTELPAERRSELQGLAANSLLLNQVADGLRKSFAAAGIAAAVVKGPSFAERLYPPPLWRSFTDIDLLVARADMERAGRVMEDEGYRQEHFALKHEAGYAETKWLADRGLEVLVELHWDMIGSPTMRHGRRLDLALLGGPEGAATANAFLLIAAIHTALGDGFTRLQPLVDLLSVVRGTAGPLDADWLGPRIAEGRLGRPLALALAIAGRAFEEPRCAALVETLPLPRIPLAVQRLVSDTMLVTGRRSGSRLASLRRQLLREWLKQPG